MYRPPSVRGTVSLPGTSGGVNWGGGAYAEVLDDGEIAVGDVVSWAVD